MTYDGGRVAVDLRPVSSLLPHEETIDSKTREIATQLQKDGIQKDPLIVDRASGVVLDGMHRLSAFVLLRIEHVACSLVDYGSPDISLSRWARIYKTTGSRESREMVEEVGLAERCSESEALGRLERREAPVAAFVRGEAFLPEAAGGIMEGFSVVRRVDHLAQLRDWERSFAGEDEIDLQLRTETELVVLVQKLNKRAVVEAGVAKRPFPCKTSMHVVDPRPVSVAIPLDELKTGSRKTLEVRLGRVYFEVLPPNSVYEGRRYKERLLVLGGN